MQRFQSASKTAVRFLDAAEKSEARRSSLIKTLDGIARSSAGLLLSERALSTSRTLREIAGRSPVTGLGAEPLSEVIGEAVRLIMQEK
jgi:hypothetical protein